MNRKTYYLIADIIQKNRTWIKVIGTEKLVEMRILQDGMLKPLLFKAITLKSYREHSVSRGPVPGSSMNTI